VYRRTVGELALTFGVSGKLWKNALIMYDRETGTLWSHLTGEAVWGPLEGEMLEPVTSVPKIKWNAWKDLHPTGQVLSIAGTEYIKFDNYNDYHRSRRTGLFEPGHRDNRLRDKTLVLGVLSGEDRKAYPLDKKTYKTKQKNAWNLIQDVISETPVIAYHNPDQYATGVWNRRLSNGTTLTFPSPTEGHYATDAEGHTWNLLTGMGPEGKKLTPLPHMNIYWFAWADFYPETGLWE